MHIHLEHFLPFVRGVVGDVYLGTEQRGVVQQPVETAERLAYGVAERRGVIVREGGQIARYDHRFGVGMLADPVEQVLEFRPGAAEQHHVGTVARISHGRRFADAVTGAGNQNDLTGQAVGFGLKSPASARLNELGVVTHHVSPFIRIQQRGSTGFARVQQVVHVHIRAQARLAGERVVGHAGDLRHFETGLANGSRELMGLDELGVVVRPARQ